LTIIHHLDDATILSYAAGTLGEALSVAAACHISMCPECRTAVRKTGDAQRLFLLPGEKVRMRASVTTIFVLIGSQRQRRDIFVAHSPGNDHKLRRSDIIREYAAPDGTLENPAARTTKIPRYGAGWLMDALLRSGKRRQRRAKQPPHQEAGSASNFLTTFSTLSGCKPITRTMPLRSTTA